MFLGSGYEMVEPTFMKCFSNDVQSGLFYITNLYISIKSIKSCNLHVSIYMGMHIYE